jgi:hypothetical protein
MTMPARGSAPAREVSLPRPEDEQNDCPFAAPNSLPDSCVASCHELAERLTAAANYLAAVQRLLEIGYQRGQPLPAEILEKASSQIAQAGEVAHQLRRMLTAYRKG